MTPSNRRQGTTSGAEILDKPNDCAWNVLETDGYLSFCLVHQQNSTRWWKTDNKKLELYRNRMFLSCHQTTGARDHGSKIE
jgi:hypothetical protein